MDEQTERLIGENRRFTILQLERDIDSAQNARNRSAIIAGACILGAAAAAYLGGQDISQVLQHELQAIYSWDALGQYFQDLGPLTTTLAAGAGAFLAKYSRNSRKLREAQQAFEDFNATLENTNTNELGGNQHVRTR